MRGKRKRASVVDVQQRLYRPKQSAHRPVLGGETNPIRESRFAYPQRKAGALLRNRIKRFSHRSTLSERLRGLPDAVAEGLNRSQEPLFVLIGGESAEGTLGSKLQRRRSVDHNRSKSFAVSTRHSYSTAHIFNPVLQGILVGAEL